MALLLMVFALLFGVGFGSASTGSWHAAPQRVVPSVQSGTKDPCVRGYTHGKKKRALPRGCAPRLAPPLP